MNQRLMQQILAELPEARDEVLESDGLFWPEEANLSGVLGELQAMRQAESLGYLHHAELHQRQAIVLLRREMARRTEHERRSPSDP